MRKLLPLLPFFLLASCSVSLQDQYCNNEGATNAARIDASAWKAHNPMEHGIHCKEEDDFNDATYTNVYNNVYDQVMGEQCSQTGLTNFATRNVSANDYSMQKSSVLERCERVGKKTVDVQKFYKSTFKKQYCNSTNFKRLASQDALALREKNYDYLSACKKKKKFKKVYASTWNKTIQDACGPVKLIQMAKADARAMKDQVTQMSRLEICPKSLKQNAKTSYLLTYQQEQNLINQEAKMKELQAQIRVQQYELSRKDFTVYNNRYQTRCELTEDGAKVTTEGPEVSSGGSGAKFKVDFFNEDGTNIDSRTGILYLSSISDKTGNVYSEYASESKSCSVRYLRPY